MLKAGKYTQKERKKMKSNTREMSVTNFDNQEAVIEQLHDMSVGSDKIAASFGRMGKAIFPVAGEAISAELTRAAQESENFGEMLSVYYSAVLSTTVTIIQNAFDNEAFDLVRADLMERSTEWFADLAQHAREKSGITKFDDSNTTHWKGKKIDGMSRSELVCALKEALRIIGGAA